MKHLILLVVAVVSLTACGRGPDGPHGAKGDVGSIGAAGVQGQQGVAGIAGTQIVPVKFCVENAAYPAVFPEYGLCINNQMYGVYSTNGGFLALLPVGSYNSNAVGSACTFTITTNCGVAH